MDQLVGIAFFLLFAGVVGFYIYRSYAKMAPAGMAAHYGLRPDERLRSLWPGELDLNVSAAAKAGTVALGLVAGALVGGIGIARAHAPGITVIITTQGRVVLSTQVDEKKFNRAYFSAPHELRIRVLGLGARKVNGLPSEIVELVGTDGVPLRALLVQGAGAELTAWSQGRAA